MNRLEFQLELSTLWEKIDDISRRTQGKPSAADIQRVTSDFEGNLGDLRIT